MCSVGLRLLDSCPQNPDDSRHSRPLIAARRDDRRHKSRTTKFPTRGIGAPPFRFLSPLRVVSVVRRWPLARAAAGKERPVTRDTDNRAELTAVCDDDQAVSNP